MSRLKRQVLILLVAAGLIAAVALSLMRLSAEAQSRTVALALDYTDLQRVADLSGRRLEELLQAVREAGVTHIALTEWSLEELLSQPEIAAAPPSELVQSLEARLPGSLERLGPPGDTPARLAPWVSRARVSMKDLGVGYDPAARDLLLRHNLKIIARPRPDYTLTPRGLQAALDAALGAGARLVIFNGTQVLGNSGMIPDTARGLGERRLLWGMVELVPQQGEHALAARLNHRLLRVHSISEAEMAERMTPPRALERFSLAARERKVRLCYVRLFFNQGEVLSTNLDYVRAVADRLRADGFLLGEPRLEVPLSVPAPFRIALYLAVGAAALWLLQHFLGLGIAAFWALFLLLVIDAVAEGFLGRRFSAEVAALFAALIFPAWGLISLRWPDRPLASPVKRAVVAYLGISLLSLAGGLLLAASLTSLPHLVGVEQFRGVKLAQILPLALLGLVLVGRSMKRYEETALEVGERRGELLPLREGLAEALGYAVRYWHAVVALLVLVAVSVMLLRSGNESFLGASAAERQLRAFLDQLLWVRPRTKEFAFGHPLLLFSLILLFSGARRGVWLGLLAGAVGQVSLVNTYAHLHTPLLVSLVRTFHGLWLGLVIGLLLWLVVSWVARRLRCPLGPPAASAP